MQRTSRNPRGQCGGKGRVAQAGWASLVAIAMAAAVPAEEAPRGNVAHRFPDFNLAYVPPATEYDGPLFRLSQEYPRERPEVEPEVRAILSIPFDRNEQGENWKRYLLAVRDYCFAGNLEVDWRGQDNQVRTWYHVPWQHVGEKGREGINGLTREATAQVGQLAATQMRRHQTHAVAMYNPLGGYTIGRVWQDQFQPDPTQSIFPVGTVVVKVLFTQADESEVPYLQDPVRWKAYVQDPADATRRKVQDLQLIQVDVMVRDDRANATGGWVFGTYCYNCAVGAANRWENLVPVGIQWGNDPEVTDPADNPENRVAMATLINKKLKETIINCSADLPPQHLGWGGRLNGPADNYRSSCMSCHATAQYPVVAPQHPDFDRDLGYAAGSAEWNAWFRNLACGESFSPINDTDPKRAVSTDFSLQLAIGIDNFYKWKSHLMGGYFTPLVTPDGTLPDRRVEVFAPASEADPYRDVVPQHN